MSKEQKPPISRYIVLIISALFLILAMPKIIDTAYFIGLKKAIPPNTTFSSENAIVYYGSVLTFIGTTFLGGVSLRQNRRLHEENKILLVQIERDRRARLHRPYYQVEEVSTVLKELFSESPGFWSGNPRKDLDVQANIVRIKLINVSENLATDVKKYYIAPSKYADDAGPPVATSHEEAPDDRLLILSFSYSSNFGSPLSLDEGRSYIKFSYLNDIGTKYFQSVPVEIHNRDGYFLCTVFGATLPDPNFSDELNE